MTADNGTYYGTYSNITLGPSEISVTFAPGADIYTTFGDAIQGGGENAYTIVNEGMIRSEDGFGIYLPQGGTVTNMAGAVIEGTDGISIASGSIINAGTIYGTGKVGILLSGDLLNEAGGLIEGKFYGVVAAGAAGTITNYGTIVSPVSLNSAGWTLVADAESVFDGRVAGFGATLDLGAGGGAGTITDLGGDTPITLFSGIFSDFSAYVVTAAADWTITGTAYIQSQFDTILAVDAGGTLVDDGVITLGSYGTLIVDGTISGDGSIQFSGAPGTIDLAAPNALGVAIKGLSSGETIDLTGVAFQAGDTVSYSSGALELFDPAQNLIGTLTVTGVAPGGRLVAVNDGHGFTAIVEAYAGGTYSGTYSGIFLSPAETVITISPTGVINGGEGNPITGGMLNSYTILNEGKIEGRLDIFLWDGGTVTNTASGLIDGGGVDFHGAAGAMVNQGTVDGSIQLTDGGIVTNEAGAFVDASHGVELNGGSAVNFGTIESKQYFGVGVYNGNLLNEAGGTIEGDVDGVRVGGTITGTITNYGTIESLYQHYSPSVSFFSKGWVLAVDAGSVFEGRVDGYATTLELGAAGGAGTLAGLGSGTLSGSLSANLRAFGISAYVIGADADWTTTGTAEIGFSTALDVDAGGTLTNQGTIQLEGTSFVVDTGGSLIDDGRIQIGEYGTLVVDGMLSGDGSIQFSGAPGILDASTPTALGVAIDGFSSGETIDLTGVAFQAGDSVSYAAGILDLFNPSHDLIGTLALDGLAAGARLVAVSDGRGGTAIVDAPDTGTYAGTYSALYLTPAEIEITITPTGVVNGGSEDPILGGLVSAYTILNEGLIEGAGFIVLRDGGTFTNTSAGTIDGAGLVFRGAAGTLVNQGTISGGILLYDGGLVTNETGALIQDTVSFHAGDVTLVNAGEIGASIEFQAGATGTVNNSGTIDGSVGLTSGGSFSNSVGGVVTGGIQAGSVYNAGAIYYGVDLPDGGAITNTGTITAPGSTACGVVGFSGAVDNLRSGLIEAPNGIEIAAGPGTVINLGTIDGATGFGVLVAGAPVTNGATNNTTALIEGAYCGVSLISSGEIVTNFGTIEGVSAGAIGVVLQYIGTVINYGTIEGSDGAVRFEAVGSELVLKAGSVLIGGASGDNGTLKLAGGTGTITGLGETATISGDDSGTVGGFASYIIGGAGTWTLDGSNTIGAGESLSVNGTLIDTGTLTVSGTVSGTIAVDSGTVDLTSAVTGVGLDFTGAGQIDLSQNGSYSGVSLSGFRIGDTIDLTNVTYQAGDTVTYSGGHLYLESSDHLLLAELNVSLYPQGHHLDVVADSTNGTEIENVSCFYPGTRIATPSGAVAVETLRAGDLVLTIEGDAVPVRWLGRQTVSTRFGDPLRILPIRIKAGAIGETLPARDLLCSADHAFLIDGVLIQAGALVNGRTIIRETGVPERFTYYHVECDAHALILAEGLAAETFVDNADRLGFDNFDEHLAAFPEGKFVEEMPYPRAKAQRQIPTRIRQNMERRAAIGTAAAA